MSSFFLRSSLVLMMGCGSSLLQADQDSLNLLEVYNFAVKNSSVLQVAETKLKITQEGVKQKRSSYLPKISLDSNASYVGDRNHGGDNFSHSNSYDVGVTVNQVIYDRAKSYQNITAKTLVEKDHFEYKKKKQALVLTVVVDYFDILRQEDQVMSIEAEKKAIQQQLELAKERYNVGLVPQTDVLEAQSAYDAIKIKLAINNNLLEDSYEKLRLLIKHDVKNIGKLNKTMPLDLIDEKNLNYWESTVNSSNFDLLIGNQELLMANNSIQVNKSSFYPKVSIVGSYKHRYNHDTVTSKKDNGMIGLNISMNLFDGGVSSSKVLSSVWSLENAQLELDEVKRKLHSDMRNHLRSVKVKVANIDAMCHGITSSESALVSVKSGYQVGTRGISAVLDAQKQLFSAERDYLGSRYDYILKVLNIKQLAGQLTDADILVLNKWIVKSEDANVSIPKKCRFNKV